MSDRAKDICTKIEELIEEYMDCMGLVELEIRVCIKGKNTIEFKYLEDSGDDLVDAVSGLVKETKQ